MSGKIDRITDAATIVAGLSAAVVATVVVFQVGARAPNVAPGEPREISEWRRYAEVGHRLGPADAPVTIIEFGDYQCPVCRSWHPHIEAALRKHPDDVAFVYRHWPLSYHQYAYPAARAAECAGEQGRFWDYHRLLYENDNWLGDAMVRFADEAGIEDAERFEQCLTDTSTVPAIEADIADAHELGARGTPTVIVNGRLLISAPDSLSLDALIQEILQ